MLVCGIADIVICSAHYGSVMERRSSGQPNKAAEPRVETKKDVVVRSKVGSMYV